MYYLGIKCDDDPYDLNYLDFYFDDKQKMIKFATHILDVSNYEIVMKNLEDE